MAHRPDSTFDVNFESSNMVCVLSARLASPRKLSSMQGMTASMSAILMAAYSQHGVVYTLLPLRS